MSTEPNRNFNRNARRGRPLSLSALVFLAGIFPFFNVNAGQWSVSQFSHLAPVLFYDTGEGLPTIPGLSFNPSDNIQPTSPYFAEAGLAPAGLANSSGPGGYSYLDISFNPPVQAVGGYPDIPVYPYQDTITETVYDKNSNIIESASVAANDYGPTFLGIGETTTNICKVEWRYTNPEFIEVPNIIYQPGPSITLGKTVSTSTNISFQFQSLSGHTNIVQTSTNLGSGNWTTLTNFTFMGDGGMRKITVTKTNGPAVFFRTQAF